MTVHGVKLSQCRGNVGWHGGQLWRKLNENILLQLGKKNGEAWRLWLALYRLSVKTP